MKRKYRDAAHAKAALRQAEPDDDDDEDALDTLNGFDEWAMHQQQDETNNHEGNQP